jgi:hypothetical protein
MILTPKCTKFISLQHGAWGRASATARVSGSGERGSSVRDGKLAAGDGRVEERWGARGSDSPAASLAVGGGTEGATMSFLTEQRARMARHENSYEEHCCFFLFLCSWAILVSWKNLIGWLESFFDNRPVVVVWHGKTKKCGILALSVLLCGILAVLSYLFVHLKKLFIYLLFLFLSFLTNTWNISIKYTNFSLNVSFIVFMIHTNYFVLHEYIFKIIWISLAFFMRMSITYCFAILYIMRGNTILVIWHVLFALTVLSVSPWLTLLPHFLAIQWWAS